MQIQDAGHLAYLTSQQSIRGKARETQEGALPADSFTPLEGGEDEGVTSQQKMREGVKRAPMQLGTPKESIERMEAFQGYRGSPEELREIKKELMAQHKELHKGGLDSAGKAHLADVHTRLEDVKGALAGMESVSRGMAWERVEKSAGGEISPVYEEYFRSTKVPAGEMEEIIKVGRELSDPASPRRIGGNAVAPLVRGEIWEKKMALLDSAVREPVRNGRPVEIDVEYYELSDPDMIGKLKDAAKAGADVRVLVDAGHFRGTREGEKDASELAYRMRTVDSLKRDGGDNIGVALFANKEVLGSRGEIMHRKIFRVGDEVVFGGMNANKGSQENVDFATTIEGPAAKGFVDNFRRDVELSNGKGVEEIYGDQVETLRGDENTSLRPGGMVDLLDAKFGAKAGITGREPLGERVDRLLQAAKESGTDPASLADFGGKDVRDVLLGREGKLRLTGEGTELLTSTIEEKVSLLNERGNRDALASISDPATAAKGKETLAIGDNKVERQAMVLHAIDSADKYIKVSAFVLNEDLARLLVQKKKDMEAKGQDFQVQVVMDPGIYEYGGTPNEPAYKLLEKEGVPVKWAALERTDPTHDRKVHAKLLITDKEMLTGSTNFSTKGLRDNWELTDVTFFTKDDPESARTAEKVNADFDRLWSRESLALDTTALAEKKFQGYQGKDAAVVKDEYRSRVLRTFLREISNYEMESGKVIRQTLAPPRAHGGTGGETPWGYDALKSIGDDGIDRIRGSSEAWQRLQNLQRNGV